MAEKKKLNIPKKQKKPNGLTPAQARIYDLFFWIDPIDMKDPDTKALKDRINLYRKVTETQGIIPTLTGLAIALGHNKGMLIDIREGRKKAPQEVREILQRTHRWLEDALVQTGFNNPLGATYTIWLQKNNYGYRDSVDITLQAQNLLTDGSSSQDVLQRYNFITESVVAEQPAIEERSVVDGEFIDVGAPEASEMAFAVEDIQEPKEETEEQEEPL